MLLRRCDSRPEAGLLPEPGTGERAVAYPWLFLMATGPYQTAPRRHHPAPHPRHPPGPARRAAACRWLFLMATGLYETDLRWYYPDRYTADPAGADGVKQAAKERMDRPSAQADAAPGPGPWPPGGRVSA